MSRSVVIGHPAELGDVITRPGTLRPEHIGPTLLGICMAGTVAAWLGYAVGKADPVVFLGEALGCWSVGLMSLGLVLMGFRRQLEGWFGGLDKVMRWHKRLSIAGVALLVPHIPMATTVASRGNSSPLAVLSAVLLGVMMLWTLGPALTSRIPRLGLPSPSAFRRAHARPFALPGGVARWSRRLRLVAALPPGHRRRGRTRGHSWTDGLVGAGPGAGPSVAARHTRRSRDSVLRVPGNARPGP